MSTKQAVVNRALEELTDTLRAAMSDVPDRKYTDDVALRVDALITAKLKQLEDTLLRRIACERAAHYEMTTEQRAERIEQYRTV